TVPIGWSTNLTGGVRYSHDRRRLRGQRLGLDGAVLLTIPSTVQNPGRFQKITWHLSLDHQFSDDVMGYVSFSRGFKSGVYAPTVLNGPLVKPETLDAYEAGLKSWLMNRSVRL